MTLFHERLWPPVTWWVLGLLLAASVGWVLLLVLPSWVAALAAVGTAVVVGAAFVQWSTAVSVDAAELRVGRAHVERRYVGQVEPLDAVRTRAMHGREADARAFHHVRPYVRTAVRVEIVDRDDPVPYWLVSTREPQRLADAMQREP